MKNKSLMILALFSGLALSACGTLNPSTSLVDNASPSTSSQTSPSNNDDSTVSESPSVSEIPSTSVVVSPSISEEPSVGGDIEGYTKVANWPTTAVSEYLLTSEITTAVPAYTATKDFYYANYEDEYGPALCVICYSDSNAEALAHIDILDKAGWTTDATTYADYDFFLAQDPDATVLIQIQFSEGATYWFIAPAGGSYESSTVWPSDIIGSFLTGNGVTDVTIPSYADASEFFYAEAEDEEYGHYLEVYIESADNAATIAYADILTKAGWTVTEVETDLYFETTDAGKQVLVEVMFLEDYQQTVWYFTLLDKVEVPVAEDGVATFDFSVETALITKDPTQSVWTISPISMTVDKGTSTVNVGNASYFSNPLRIYASQVVTFSATAGYSISSIVIDVSDAKYLAPLTASTIEGGTISGSETQATITVSEGATSVTITASAQFRFAKAVVNFAEVVA